MSSRAKASSALRSCAIASSASNARSFTGRRSRLDTPALIRRCTVRAMRAASSPTRSRLAIVFEIAISRRRSRAVGWRRAMMVDRSRSISTSIWLTRSSVCSTWSAVSPLKLASA